MMKEHCPQHGSVQLACSAMEERRTGVSSGSCPWPPGTLLLTQSHWTTLTLSLELSQRSRKTQRTWSPSCCEALKLPWSQHIGRYTQREQKSHPLACPRHQSRVCVGEKLRLITSCAYHGATSSESPHIAVFTEPHVTLQSAKCFLKNRPGSERVLQNITWVEYGFDENTKC